MLWVMLFWIACSRGERVLDDEDSYVVAFLGEGLLKLKTEFEVTRH